MLVGDDRRATEYRLCYRNGLYACGYAAVAVAGPTDNWAAVGMSCETNTELPVTAVNVGTGDDDKTNGDMAELVPAAGPV
jgi:hypothetical protein